MTEKVHKEKLQGVETRLTYGGSSHRDSQTLEETQLSTSESCDRRRRPKKRRKPRPVIVSKGTRPSQSLSVFSRLRHEGDKPTRRRSPAAAKIEWWAMPTWCHMFKSTLIGSSRVWIDKLPPESIDNYKVLWKAFLGNFSQQKKYIKYPVEIHHIKQRGGESIEALMERFKAESMHVNGAPECMRIYGIMHDITN
ncbi:reverse transcriptase domain-containing protein [Tanacetum coccineum]